MPSMTPSTRLPSRRFACASDTPKRIACSTTSHGIGAVPGSCSERGTFEMKTWIKKAFSRPLGLDQGRTATVQCRGGTGRQNFRVVRLAMDSETVCPGLASTSSARMATKLVGAIAITAPARVAKSRTAMMLTQPSASALRVRAQKGRWEPVGQSGVAACSSG